MVPPLRIKRSVTVDTNRFNPLTHPVAALGQDRAGFTEYSGAVSTDLEQRRPAAA